MICSAEDLFTLSSDKFRMVYKVDGNTQLDSRNWSMYSNILKQARDLPYLKEKNRHSPKSQAHSLGDLAFKHKNVHSIITGEEAQGLGILTDMLRLLLTQQC